METKLQMVAPCSDAAAQNFLRAIDARNEIIRELRKENAVLEAKVAHLSEVGRVVLAIEKVIRF